MSADAPEPGLKRLRHVAVEGPIGVGKTTLARRLAAHLGAELLLEQPNENPMLGRFYEDMAGYAFQTQLQFLFQRVKQMQALAQPGMFDQGWVSDFLFDKDAIFARMTLSDDEHRLYAQMYAQVAPRVAPPDLIILLQASPATLLSRVRQRGIAMEQGIPVDYLQRLGNAYADFFRSYRAAPVLRFDTEHFNPGEVDADFEQLLGAIARWRQGRPAQVSVPLPTPWP